MIILLIVKKMTDCFKKAIPLPEFGTIIISFRSYFRKYLICCNEI